MSADNLAYWGAALLPPVGAFLMNLAVRWPHVLRSTGADWLLVLFSFDATAILTANDISRYVQHPDIKASFTIFMVASLLLTWIVWFIVASRIEAYVARNAESVWMKVKRSFAYLSAWTAVAILSSAHIYLFLYEPS